MMSSRLHRSAAPLLVALALSACADSPDYERIVDETVESSTRLIDKHIETPSRPLVVSHEGAYVDQMRIAHAGETWLHEWVELRASELPMNMTLGKALDQLVAPPSVVYAADLDQPDTPVTIDHRGPFKEFLDRLAEASGYGWEQKGGALHWMKNILRTYEIHRIPGNLEYTMENQAGSGELEEAAERTINLGDDTDRDSASNLITLSGGGTFWDDLATVLTNMMANEEGALPPSIDRSSGTVTLQGPAHAVHKAGRYIADLNRLMERQVLLEVQLVHVTLTGERKLGIDWELIQQTASTVVTSTSDLAGDLISGGARFGVGLSETSGSIFRGSEFVINALEGQGRTSVQTSPRIVAMNGQAAQLQVISDRSIIASRSVVVTGGLTNTQTESVQPGVVSTGIALTILPKIIGDRIFLQASIQVSELVDLVSDGGRDQEVTLPHVQRNQFFQSARLVSGETLVLGGLIMNKGSESGKHLPSTILGTDSKTYDNVETVLLITPTLLDRPRHNES